MPIHIDFPNLQRPIHEKIYGKGEIKCEMPVWLNSVHKISEIFGTYLWTAVIISRISSSSLNESLIYSRIKVD